MTLLQIVVLAVVQGITEFLPISSSAHLILVPEFTDWPDQGTLMDVAVHVGTLAAVMVYFHRDLWAMVRGLGHLAARRPTAEARLVGVLMVATVPVVVIGAAFYALDVNDAVRDPEVIGWTTLVFGLVLWLADRKGPTDVTVADLGWRAAALIGLAQAVALVPGVSRSGITMTAGRALGFDRTRAARFALLLAIPTLAAAGLLGAIEIVRSGDQALGADAVIGAGLSFVTALIAIWALMRWLRSASFAPFVIYRVVLGVGLLAWVYL